MDFPTDISTGAFKGKIPFTDLLQEFKAPLAIIGLVHRRGARKYAAYSWLRDPGASNSTIWENIDALVRHMTAHSMGYIRDPEGLPHIFHICCRAGMLVSTHLREQIPVPFRWTDTTHDSESNLDPWCWLTPEELLALSFYPQFKEQLDSFYTDGHLDLDKLHEYLYSTLIRAATSFIHTGRSQVKEDAFGAISLYEAIFLLSLVYAREYLQNYTWDQLVDIKELTEDDKKYCEQFIK